MTAKQVEAFDAYIVAITERLEALDSEGRSIFLQRTTSEAGGRRARRG
jgi:hypothetical protein